MIITSIVHWCPACHSANIVKNGHTLYGAQRCKCRDCGKTRVLIPKRESPIRDFVENALRERLSLRGIARIFGVSVQTVLLLLKRLVEALPSLKASLMPSEPGDVLEPWANSTVLAARRPKNAGSGWRSAVERGKWWPMSLEIAGRRPAVSCSGGFRTVAARVTAISGRPMRSTGRHASLGKGSGETAHVERWNCTLRQRVSRYVRKTLSFSKTDEYHHLATKYFIWHYNLDRIINTF